MNEGSFETTQDLCDVSILIIDDDEIDVRAVKRELAAIRLTNPVFVASDGIQGLEKLRGTGGTEKIQGPVMVLLDLNMPRLDGIGFLKELRSDPALSKTIVFVLTTSSDHEDIAASYSQHVSGYIVKSQAGDSLLRVFRMLSDFALTVKFPPKA